MQNTKDLNCFLNISDLDTINTIIDKLSNLISEDIDNENSNITSSIDVNTIIDKNIDSSLNDSTSNCLALTIRKNYNLISIKNIFSTTGKISLKILISTFILNILSILL